jgi:leader peptidase (prepilin peptidase)/N-methyltransferase
MVIVILLVLGLCFGSFVNAFVWRFHEQAELKDRQLNDRQAPSRPAGRKSESAKPAVATAARNTKALRPELTAQDLSISKGRSMCVHCHHELAAKDLVPVISYVWLRGRCRYCGKPIQDTPLAELLTPLLFVASYVFWPLALSGAGLVAFCGWLVFLVGFVMLGLYDLRWFELPHRIVMPLIVLAVILTIGISVVFDAAHGGGWGYAAHAGLGGLIIGGLFFLLYLLSPKQMLDDGTTVSKWIGGGDITLGFLLGLLVGGVGNALLLIFMASLIGTVVALPLLAAGRATRSSHLPFGPFLMLAAVIVKLWGAALIAWYTGQFLL